MPKGIPHLKGSGPKLPGTKKKTQPESRCIHEDCIYRSVRVSDSSFNNTCNYCLITGHSRIKGLPEAEQDPALCKKYRKGRRQQIDKEMHLKTPFA